MTRWMFKHKWSALYRSFKIGQEPFISYRGLVSLLLYKSVSNVGVCVMLTMECLVTMVARASDRDVVAFGGLYLLFSCRNFFVLNVDRRRPSWA